VDMVKTVWFQLRQDQRKTLGNYNWIFVVKEIAGVIQVMLFLDVNVVISFPLPILQLNFVRNYFHHSFVFFVEKLREDLRYC
jgi:hypothetical protein